MNALIALQAEGGATGGGFGAFLPLILIIVIFYFFMIRPQMKRNKELKQFRDSLEKGDKVVTTGGIYGKVVEIGDYYVMLEVDSNVKIKIDKAAVVKDMTDAAPAK